MLLITAAEKRQHPLRCLLQHGHCMGTVMGGSHLSGYLNCPSLPSPVRDPQGTIRLYTKGADTVILERLQRRGPKETFTEMALDVSPMPAWGRKGWSLLLALGWVSWSPLLLFFPLASGFWSVFLPSALGASPACKAGGKRASNHSSVFCMDQLHCEDAQGDAVGWGRESEPRRRPSDPGVFLALSMGASWLAGRMP